MPCNGIGILTGKSLDVGRNFLSELFFDFPIDQDLAGSASQRRVGTDAVSALHEMWPERSD